MKLLWLTSLAVARVDCTSSSRRAKKFKHISRTDLDFELMEPTNRTSPKGIADDGMVYQPPRVDRELWFR